MIGVVIDRIEKAARFLSTERFIAASVQTISSQSVIGDQIGSLQGGFFRHAMNVLGQGVPALSTGNTSPGQTPSGGGPWLSA